MPRKEDGSQIGQDIAQGKKSQTLDPEKIKREAISLHVRQRDLFTPLCLNLALAVSSLSSVDMADAAIANTGKPIYMPFQKSKNAYLTLSNTIIIGEQIHQGPGNLLSRYKELVLQIGERNMNPNLTNEFHSLSTGLSIIDPDAFKIYRRLLNTSKRRPLNEKESAQLVELEGRLKSDDSGELRTFQAVAEKFGLLEESVSSRKLAESLMVMTDNLHKADVKGLKPANYKYFLWTQTGTDVDNFSHNAFIVPVGENGSELAIKIMYSGRMLMRLADQFVEQQAQTLSESESKFILSKTTRGLDPKDVRSPNPALTTLQEGIVSIINSFSLLTATKYRRLPDPDELMEALVNQQIVNQFAHRVYPGFLQPSLFAGEYFRNLLNVDADGNIHFSKAFTRNMHSRLVASKAVYELSGNLDQFTFNGCPVAERSSEFSESGIEALTKAFYKLYSSFPTVKEFLTSSKTHQNISS